MILKYNRAFYVIVSCFIFPHVFFPFSFIVNIFLPSSKQCFVIVPEGQHASFNDSQVSWSKFWKVKLNKYYILLLFTNFT